jgi:hypothetical protein
MLRSLDAITIESLMDGGEEFIFLKRLGQEFDRSRLDRARRHRDITVRGDEDNRDVVPHLREALLKFQATHSRKPHIEYQTTGGGGLLCAQKLVCRTERYGAKSN